MLPSRREDMVRLAAVLAQMPCASCAASGEAARRSYVPSWLMKPHPGCASTTRGIALGRRATPQRRRGRTMGSGRHGGSKGPQGGGEVGWG
eukprot:52475-Eustigmatos_ZCMA.PRE.1